VRDSERGTFYFYFYVAYHPSRPHVAVDLYVRASLF